MTRTAALLSFVCAAVAPLGVLADAPSVPLYISHQGRLLEGTDKPVNAAVSLKFTLHSKFDELAGDPSSAVWTATYNVTVVDGFYAVLLGDKSDAAATALPASVFDGSAQRFLSISVNGGADTKPRLRIGAVPFALLANSALTAHAADTAVAADHAETAVTAGTAAKAGDADKLGGKSITEIETRFDDRYAPKTGAAYIQLQGTSPGTPQQGHLNLTGSVVAQQLRGDGAGLTGLAADSITTGLLDEARLPGALGRPYKLTNAGNEFTGKFAGDGAGLTLLDATQITGTIPDARHSSNIATLTGAQTFTGKKTFGDAAVTGTLTIGSTTSNAALSVGGGVQLGDDAASCTTAKNGTLRFSNNRLEICAGTTWSLVVDTQPAGTSQARPGRSCKVLRDDGTRDSGLYWIDPDGSGGQAAFRAYCDMTTFPGEGWTVLAYAPNHSAGDPMTKGTDRGTAGDMNAGWNQTGTIQAVTTGWFTKFRGYYRYLEDQPSIPQTGQQFTVYVDYTSKTGEKYFSQLSSTDFTNQWGVTTSEGVSCSTFHSLFTPFWDTLAQVRTGGAASHNYCGYYHSPEGWCSQAYAVNSCNRNGYGKYVWAWFLVR